MSHERYSRYAILGDETRLRKVLIEGQSISGVIWSGYPEAKGPMTDDQLKKNLSKEYDFSLAQLATAYVLKYEQPLIYHKVLIEYQRDRVNLLEKAQDLDSLEGKIAAKAFLREKQQDLEIRLDVLRTNHHNPTLIYYLESQLTAVESSFNLIIQESVSSAATT